MSVPVTLLTGPTDQEQAIVFRDRITKPLDEVMMIINEARNKGMIINFQIGPPDAFGRQSLVLLEITKKLC